MTTTEQIRSAIADRYVIERELGAGGMATVYLAHDVKHDRQVALKVLRPELAAVIGGERFLQEIKVTANLQHPHILPLFDSGEAGSFLYYVMPYVEGETLRDKLAREKQLNIEEAVRIAREAADALDYAHRRGVVHRDIKPENILLHDGRVMVADFGIALAVSQAGAGRMTETGMSLGTPHYMSPEQAMGEREITAKSDVYALGCVLYEMLTGEPPFTGATAQAVVARVVTEQPRPLLPQRHTVPPHVEATVLQALEKLPADRFGTAAEFNAALSGTAQIRTSTRAFPQVTARRPARGLMAAVAGAALAAGGLAGWWLHRPAPAPLRFFTITEGDSGETRQFGMTLAPDGDALVFNQAQADGSLRLMVRRLEESRAVQVPSAVGGGLGPRFSPDGRNILYLGATAGLFRTTLTSPDRMLLADSAGFGAAWGTDGFIYYADFYGSLVRVPEGGGVSEVLHRPDSIFNSPYAWPEPLPNGRGVVVTQFAYNARSSFVLVAVDVREKSARPLVAGMYARYLPSGHLLYVTLNRTLVIAPFDQDRMEFTGPPVPVATELIIDAFGFAAFDISASGTLVYQTAPGGLVNGAVAGLVDVVLVGRDGTEQALPVPPDYYNALALSPDGSLLALEVVEGGQDGGRIVLLEMGDSVLSRLTFDGVNTYPVFTPDGRRIAFSRFADGNRDLAWKPVEGTGRSETLFTRPGDEFEVAFHPDGRSLVYRTGNASTIADLELRTRQVDGSGDTVFVDRQGVFERAMSFSPDGKWIAYVSNETGADEVFVRPFPDEGSGAVWQVSQDGGAEPVWAHNGRELFYKGPQGLMVATVRSRPTFAVVDRRLLFGVTGYLNNAWHARYAVLPGDERFLMIRTTGQAVDVETHVVLNWRDHFDPEAR